MENWGLVLEFQYIWKCLEISFIFITFSLVYIAGITEVPLKYAIVEQKVNSEKRIVRQVRRASIKNLI